MKSIHMMSSLALGALTILVPAQSEARIKTYCDLKEGYITQVNHGDLYEDTYPILVIKYLDIDGKSRQVSTRGLQDMRTQAEARSLESMAVSAMLAKARVRFLFNKCLYNEQDGQTWLWGMEMKGG